MITPELAALALLTWAPEASAAPVEAPSVETVQAESQSPPQPPAASAAGGDADLATQLANPVSSLISVPFQFNYDCCFGPEDASRYTLNIQPVIPFKLSPDLSLVVRTIIPVIDQEATTEGSSGQFGFGDFTQTFFFSPPSRNGLTWAVGPAFLWPVGTDGLSSGKWAAGPSALVLRQQSGTTIGFLANHLWSYAGDSDRNDISATFLQPFLSHTWPSTTGVTLNMEASYDWHAEEWTVPVNLGVSHIYSFGTQKVQMGIFGRAYLDAPEGGPDWGVRFVMTLLIPD